MPVLNFLKQFEPLVASGEKRQTIRPPRKDGRNPQPGQTLYLYTGMRTKGCKKLTKAECISSEPILIDSFQIIVGVKSLSWSEQAELARLDGFENEVTFIEFFRKQHGLPFHGFLIKW